MKKCITIDKCNEIVPHNIVKVLHKFMNIKSVVCISLLNRKYNKFIMQLQFASIDNDLGDIVLKQKQYIASTMIKEAFEKSKTVILNAPLGFGKTFTVLHYLYTHCKNKKILITVPTQVLKVWIEEYNKIGFLDSKIDNTKVLIYDITRRSHKEYCDENINNIFKKVNIIIAKDITYKNNKQILDPQIDLLIIEEYHKCKILDHETGHTLGMTSFMI